MIVFSSLSLLVPGLLPLASFSSSSVWSLLCEMIPLGKEEGLFISRGFVRSMSLLSMLCPSHGSLGCGGMGVHRTGMAAWPIFCHELLLLSLNIAM